MQYTVIFGVLNCLESQNALEIDFVAMAASGFLLSRAFDRRSIV
jgi:hypothetical protein